MKKRYRTASRLNTFVPQNNERETKNQEDNRSMKLLLILLFIAIGFISGLITGYFVFNEETVTAKNIKNIDTNKENNIPLEEKKEVPPQSKKKIAVKTKKDDSIKSDSTKSKTAAKSNTKKEPEVKKKSEIFIKMITDD